jgi:hypothetical protein
MATKKKTSKKSSKPSKMQISGKLFLEYKAAMEAMFHARKDLELRELQFAVAINRPEHAALLKSRGLVDAAMKKAAERQTEFKMVQARVVEKLGIDKRELYKCKIEEYSGTMVFTPQGEDSATDS